MKIALLVLLLSGCSIAGYTPGYIKCQGKGTITGSGAAAIGYAGTNTFNLQVDCPGDGLEFSQGKEGPYPTPSPPAKP